MFESLAGICRDDEKSGHYKMSPRTPTLSHTGTDTVSTAGESIRPRVGDVQARAFEFNPPAMIRWYTCYKDQVRVFRSLVMGDDSVASTPLHS